MSNQRTLLQSLRTLIDPKTIPFLISQGVPKKLFPLGTLLLGMILAFLWAYAISPNVYTAAEPVHLGTSWKKEYVKQVAWQYSAARNNPQLAGVAASNAMRQLGDIGNPVEIVAALLSDLEIANPADPTIALVRDIQPLAQDNPDQMAKITSSLLNSNLTPFLCLIGLAVIVGGVVIFNTIIPIGLLFKGKSSAPSTVTAGVEDARRQALAAAAQKAKDAAAAPAPVGGPTLIEKKPVDLGTPIGQWMSTYIMGDDFYDDSFSVETAAGKFLGETGAGISKVIGVGDPKKVTAVEVFVFDATTTSTLTKVLMSEHAYNDEGIRASLAPKGEAVLIREGESVLLETATLAIQARIVDLQYGTGALPPNSFFERLSIQMGAFARKTDAPATPAAFGDTNPVDLPR